MPRNHDFCLFVLGETDVAPEIYRHNLEDDKFTLHQKVPLTAVDDVTYFDLNNDKDPDTESYLIFTTQAYPGKYRMLSWM